MDNLEEIICRNCRTCKEVSIQKMFEVTDVDIEKCTVSTRYVCTNCSNVLEYHNSGFDKAYCMSLAHMLDVRKRLMGQLE